MRASAFFILLVYVLTTFSTYAQTPQRVQIGVLAPLTGPAASLGKNIRNAVELADLDFDIEDRVTFIFEDDQFSPRQAVSAAHKLFTQDAINALITFSGSVSLAVSNIAEKRRTPMFAITPLSSVSDGKRYVFTLSISSEEIVTRIVEQVHWDGFKRVAIVGTVQDAITKLRAGVVSTLKVPVVSEIEVLPHDTEFSALIDKLLSRDPDVVLNFLLPPQIARTSRLMKEHGFKGAMIGPPSLFNPSEIDAAQGSLDEAMVTFPKIGSALEFLERYRKIFGELCIPEGMYAYDAARTLIESASLPMFHDAVIRLEQIHGISGTYPLGYGHHFDVPSQLVRLNSSIPTLLAD